MIRPNGRTKHVDMLKRINAYLDQNGSKFRLTHRQERRLRKKVNRDAKASRRAEMANDYSPMAREEFEYEGRLDDVNGDPGGVIEGPVTAGLPEMEGDYPFASDVIESLESDISDFAEVGPPPFVSQCPTCNVTEGPCITKSGKPAKNNHVGRV